MIYLPASEIANYGGVDKLGKKEDFEKLKKTLLSKALVFDPPVTIDGSLAYVEQNAWI